MKFSFASSKSLVTIMLIFLATTTSAIAHNSLPKTIADPQLVQFALDAISSNHEVLSSAKNILNCESELRTCMAKSADVYQSDGELYVQWMDEDLSCRLRVHFDQKRQVIASADPADRKWVCHADN